MRKHYSEYVLFAILWGIIFSMLINNVFPYGDDIRKMASPDNPFPIPMPHLWIGNRVVDGFFIHYSFELFAHIYEIFYRVGAGYPKTFLDLFQTFASIVYASVFVLYTILFQRTARSFGGLGGLVVPATVAVMVAGCFMFYAAPYWELTTLFAYTITALISLAFLLTAFPLHGLSWAKGAGENRENLSGAKLIVLSVGSYFVAVGLEIFVVFSWIYIISYYMAIIVTRPGFDGTLRDGYLAVIRDIKGRFSIIFQFALYSGWAMYAVATSGRTEQGVKGAISAVPHFDYLSLVERSWGAKLLLGIMLACLLLVLGKIAFKKEWVGKLTRVSSISKLARIQPWATFLFFLSFGYAVALVWLSELTAKQYFVSTNFLLPLMFVVLLCVFLPLLFLVERYAYGWIKGASFLVLLMFFVLGLGNAMKGGHFTRKNEEQMRMALDEAARVKNGPVEVDFQLPHQVTGNEGYPLLPGKHAAGWYRWSFRKVLNRYYGTHFNKSGPVFVTKLRGTKKE